MDEAWIRRGWTVDGVCCPRHRVSGAVFWGRDLKLISVLSQLLRLWLQVARRLLYIV